MADIASQQRDSPITEGDVEGAADSVIRRYPLQSVVIGLTVGFFLARKGAK